MSFHWLFRQKTDTRLVSLSTGAVLLLCIGLACLQLEHIWTHSRHVTFIQLFILYFSWVCVPLTLYFIYRLCYRSRQSWSLIAVMLGCLAIYARFIEPNLTRVMHSSIVLTNHTLALPTQTLRLAVMSDLHLGLFSDIKRTERWIERINQLQPDAVLIVGDFTEEPTFRDFDRLFAPLDRLQAPTYAVLGNHDERSPGPNLTATLKTILTRHHIQVIENRMQMLDGVVLYGFKDLSTWGMDFRPLMYLSKQQPVIVLAHQPSTVHYLPRYVHSPLLMVSGHTHGGQINLPLFTSYILHRISPEGFKRGLYTVNHHQLFVTSGLGMSNFPFRFNMPPTIDMINVYYNTPKRDIFDDNIFFAPTTPAQQIFKFYLTPPTRQHRPTA